MPWLERTVAGPIFNPVSFHPSNTHNPSNAMDSQKNCCKISVFVSSATFQYYYQGSCNEAAGTRRSEAFTLMSTSLKYFLMKEKALVFEKFSLSFVVTTTSKLHLIEGRIII